MFVFLFCGFILVEMSKTVPTAQFSIWLEEISDSSAN